MKPSLGVHTKLRLMAVLHSINKSLHKIKFNLYTKEQPGLNIAQLTGKTTLDCLESMAGFYRRIKGKHVGRKTQSYILMSQNPKCYPNLSPFVDAALPNAGAPVVL